MPALKRTAGDELLNPSARDDSQKMPEADSEHTADGGLRRHRSWFTPCFGDDDEQWPAGLAATASPERAECQEGICHQLIGKREVKRQLSTASRNHVVMVVGWVMAVPTTAAQAPASITRRASSGV